MVATSTLIAAHRFGLGPRPGELPNINRNPRGWLEAQLEQPAALRPPQFIPSATVLDLRVQLRQLQASQDEAAIQHAQREFRQSYARDVTGRFLRGAQTDTPFVERMVYFWANHFAISTDKQATVALGGSFEAEAIRPHVLESFEDLLVASTRHPGMLLYLDNAQSVGPNSRQAQRNGRGLNENLAREILELHSLGVDGGYSQEDVTNFAKVITGWTVPVGPVAQRFSQAGGTFAFIDQLHEPGNHRILGKTYRQSGEDQGLAVLKDLASHPSTARHIATKLARHFIADDPPQDAIDRLSKVFLDSGGHLPTLYRALIAEPEAWKAEQQKYRTPNEWLLAIHRATGVPQRENQVQQSLVTLGHPTWRPGSPAGWSDVASQWDSPDALGKRIEWGDSFAQRAAGVLPADRLYQDLFGEGVDPDLVRAVSRAESNAQGLLLTLLSPALLRR